MKGLEIKDLPFALRAIVASDHVMGESKQDILLKSADAIEELVAAVPKWVSVEERLPQKRYAVLAYCPYNKCIYTAYWDGENWVHFGGGNIEYVSFPVTYWMPLPDTPKGVE